MEQVRMMPEKLQDKVLNINRIAKKIKGGQRIRFTSLVAVGDRKGNVGLGYGKSTDLRSAIEKANAQAKSNMFEVPLKGTTLPRRIKIKLGAAQVLLMPAPRGSGLIVGGIVRSILDLAGVKDASAKILGTNNPTTNAKATIAALRTLAEEAEDD